MSRGHVYSYCGCRSPESGKQLGDACPERGRRGHLRHGFRLDLPIGSDGKRRQVRTGGFARKSDAQRALTDALARLDRGTYVEVGRQTVRDYLDDWLAGKARLRPTTARSYEAHLRLYLIPHLGHLRLTDLRTSDVERMYRAVRAERRLSAATVRRVHATLLSALNTAVRRHLIAVNVAAHVELPSATPPPVRVWSPEQVGRFLDHCADTEDRLVALYHLVALRGLRRGEAVGLRWTDVNLDAGRLRVAQQVVQLGYAVAVGEPKTATGARTVSLDADTCGVLRAHRARQAAERLAWGAAYQDSGRVFTREDGAGLHPEYVSRHFAALARAAGLPPIRLHDLRHTAASLALAAGVPLKVVSDQLGHSSITITADTYTSVLPAVAHDAAERTAGLIPRAVRTLPAPTRTA